MAAPVGDMLWIPGGTHRMGSNRHYPEETPVHASAVDAAYAASVGKELPTEAE